MTTPTLGELRTAIAETLGGAVPELTAYPKVPDTVNLPCVIVMPTTATFAFTKADPDDTWPFDLHVLTSRGDTGLGQDALDGYLSSAGPKSLRQVIAQARNLGLTDAGSSVRARITSMSNYGGQFDAADIDHVGATLGLIVTVTVRGLV